MFGILFVVSYFYNFAKYAEFYCYFPILVNAPESAGSLTSERASLVTFKRLIGELVLSIYPVPSPTHYQYVRGVAWVTYTTS